MRSKVARLSALMRLRRHHPMEDALWLLESVGRTRGAQHLKLASRHLSLLQYFSLDCVAFLAAVLWAAWRMARLVLARCLRLCCCCRGRKEGEEEKERGGKRKKD